MNNHSIITRFAASPRRKGLFIIIAASLVLFILAIYKIPLFHNELHGTITGISEVYDETGSKLIANVQLNNGDHVLASMPKELLKSKSVDVMVNEGRTLFGRKSYTIIVSSGELSMSDPFLNK
jgi:hypothetical protein